MIVSHGEKLKTLDADDLLADAQLESGLSDFGDERFIVALRSRTASYIEDIQDDECGLGLVPSTIVRQLVNRARFERDLKEHPAIRGSRALNLAQGAMATFCTFVAWHLVDHAVPVVLAIACAVVVGAVGGGVMEKTLIRPLGRNADYSVRV